MLTGLRYRRGVFGLVLRLTRHYALTALHCLHGSDADAALDLSFASGEKVQGRVDERCPEADLVLIEILQPAGCAVSLPPSVDRAVRGDVWFSPYRPSSSDPQLTGMVSNGSMQYACESGREIEALQLDVDQPIGDYSGYSGSPVERDATWGKPALLGVLMEQLPDRRDPDRASSVLFAATIAEVCRCFNYFGVEHLRGAFSDVREVAPENSAPVAPAGTEPVAARVSPGQTEAGPVAAANAIVALLQDWAQSGVLPQAHVPELALRVAWRLVDSDWAGAGE